MTGNTVSGATLFDGIDVLTGDAPGSSITGTTITNNKVMNNARAGIGVFTNLSSAGSNTSITNTTITNNEIANNTSNGIFANAFAGQNNSITSLGIDNNNVHDNGFGGIVIASGVCGGTGNTLEATISQNILTGNEPADGTSGIFAAGGFNSCTGGPFPSASQNQLTVTITGNILMDNLGAGIGIIGGQVDAGQNTVNALVTDNTVLRSGVAGIVVTGGVGTFRTFSGPADNNTVTAAILGNRVGDTTGAGIALVGGSFGPANSNTVDAQVEGNTACGNTAADIQGVEAFQATASSRPTREQATW